MPDIIQILPDAVANQIAAGEVVQRPASAVKELLENSIDAEATDIALSIKDAGKTLIQVIDNGKGMSETDARICLERHATSKITRVEDIFAIRTMGFRGEALASIAAIAQMELKTRLKSNDTGCKIIIEGSKVESQEACAMNQGTSIAVKNLFFNVPARRNFLKSNTVETRHIIDEFQRVALTHPEIAFKLYNNEQEVLNLRPGSFRQRLVGIFGKKYNERLVPVEESTDIVSVSGFIGKPQYAKKTRGEQFFFVNDRFIKSPYLHHAIMLAYEELLPKDQFPSYFLKLDIDPSKIDVNIHPTKTEIKFEDERAIYAIIRTSVKQALGKFNIAPSLDFDQESAFDLPPLKPTDQIKPPEIKVNKDFNPFHSKSVLVQPPSTGNERSSINTSNWEKLYEEHELPVNTGNKDETKAEPTKVITSAWEDHETEAMAKVKSMQLHNRYILTHIKSGFVVIDQQRAHERILYERFVLTGAKKKLPSQQLLFPKSISLAPTDVQLFREIKSSVEGLGFTFGEVDTDQVEIKGIPSGYIEDDAGGLLEGLLEDYKMMEEVDQEALKDKLAGALARKMSVKSGQKLSEQEMDNLIDELFACAMPYALPNGKPTVITIQLDELNKRFQY